MSADILAKLAQSIITFVRRRGGNYNLRPSIDKDGVRVDYTTDCDRAGDVENSMNNFLVGFTLEEREAVIAQMKELLAKRAS